MDLELLIISALVFDQEFNRKVLIHLKQEYFTTPGTKNVFLIINEHSSKYNTAPKIDVLAIEATNILNITAPLAKDIENTLNRLSKTEYSLDWLVNKTEKWCQERAVYLAIVESIEIQDGTTINKSVDAIPDILSKALAVSFSNDVGVEYLTSAEERFDYYNNVDTDKIPFGLTYLDQITGKGFARKTLNLIMSGAGVGKSIMMCHHAANCLQEGKNVLFITLEMSAEAIAQRIDANLLQVDINKLYVDKNIYLNKFNKIQQKTLGQLYIKEYPISTAHAGNFSALIDELATKKSFSPDIIIIDYLNICASSTNSSNSNSYDRMKCIAEQLRSLAQKRNLPIMSAIQVNRSGTSNTSPDMADIADSYALAMVADFILALVSNESFAAVNQILCCQIKNRYADVGNPKKFVLSLDKPKMTFSDVEGGGAYDDDRSEFIDVKAEDVTMNFKNKKNNIVSAFQQ